ncbi:MAG: hypothetical protein QM756_43375 [Polyangiaceae bacterium]
MAEIIRGNLDHADRVPGLVDGLSGMTFIAAAKQSSTARRRLDPGGAMTVLALRKVSKSFGPIQVLHDVDLALEPGQVHALIGENGAGNPPS